MNRVEKSVTVAAVIALLVYGLWMLRRIERDPEVVFLSAPPAGAWMRPDGPMLLDIKPSKPVRTTFRRQLELPASGNPPVLHVLAFRSAEIFLDGVALPAVAPAEPRNSHWKMPREYRLPAGASRHELSIVVENATGPCIAAAWIPNQVNPSAAAWQASTEEASWGAVRDATDLPPHVLEGRFGTVAPAFRQTFPLLGSLFVAMFLVAWHTRRWPDFAHGLRDPARVRWLLVAAWTVLGVNNLLTLRAGVGFDAVAHFDYIFYIVNEQRLPHAGDGWQMFQSPLYYLLSAGLLSASLLFTSDAHVITQVLRVIPLLAGLAQIEVAFRFSRLVFRERAGLQILSMVFVAFLPMNVYLSQYLGNEPLAALFSALTVLLGMRIALADEPVTPLRQWFWLGTVWGLALLSKVTPVVLTPALAALILLRAGAAATGREMIGRIGLGAFAVGLPAAAIAGWYYVRNLLLIGRPFVGGWDPARGISWWQDPGYRTWGQLGGFDSVLADPIFCGVRSFWGGLYSTFWTDGFLSTAVFQPPWNMSFLLSLTWWSLPLSLFMVVGAYRLLRGNSPLNRTAALFCTLALAGYALGLLHHFLTVPILSTAKAFYALGALPVLALLFVLGIERFLTINRATAAAAAALVTSWGVAAYVAFYAR